MGADAELEAEWIRKGLIDPRPAAPRGSLSRATAPARVQIVVWIPGLLPRSEANTGGTTRGKIARKTALHAAVAAALPPLPFALTPPVRVTFVRVGGKRLDTDNLAHAYKAARDAVAAWLGVDDGDTAAVRWAYRQRPGWKGGTRIVIG